MHDILKQIESIKIVPVVAIHNADHAPALAEALTEGGLPCAEITFRTEAAEQAIKKTSRTPDMLIGAGTVLSVEQARKAVNAGARFIVSPGFNPKVVDYCVQNDIAVTPGICTPTDIEQALQFGLKVVKFFPAEAYGGLKTLKAMSAPYTMMKFIPTGGINASNLADYLGFAKVLACGGSWMVKSDLIDNENFDEISNRTKKAVEIAAGFRA